MNRIAAAASLFALDAKTVRELCSPTSKFVNDGSFIGTDCVSVAVIPFLRLSPPLRLTPPRLRQPICLACLAVAALNRRALLFQRREDRYGSSLRRRLLPFATHHAAAQSRLVYRACLAQCFPRLPPTV